MFSNSQSSKKYTATRAASSADANDKPPQTEHNHNQGLKSVSSRSNLQSGGSYPYSIDARVDRIENLRLNQLARDLGYYSLQR